MTNEYPPPTERFREFVSASRNLCQALSFADSHQNRALIATIFSALKSLPNYVYEDGELLGILDALVDDGLPLDPDFAEPCGGFLLTLGFAHIRRYKMLGAPQSIERAFFLSEMSSTIVSRESSPRLWAFIQVLKGDCKRLLRLISGDFTLDPLENYHNALAVIRRDDDRYTWVEIAINVARAYAEKTTGDRVHNLRTSADLFIEIYHTWELIGSIKGATEARVALADVLVSLNYNEQELQRALSYYHEAFHRFLEIGDERAAEEVSGKIKALETVHFTTYYPRTGLTGRKYAFLVYAHLLELRNDVNLDALKFSTELGDSMPTPRGSRSNVKLERDTLVTVVPECSKLKFDPPELAKRWDGSWTRFLFDFELGQGLVGEVILVRISIQVAGIEIACINNCAIEVIEAQPRAADKDPLAHAKSGTQTSTLYQKIFVSYSRRDREVTERYKLAQIALGNEAFIDVDDLRAGENWKAGLARAIDVADVFQLFWSANSAKSEYCRYEWTYALDVRCQNSKWEGFIRPVYWEKPMPDPPPELSHVNFKYVPFGGNARSGSSASPRSL